MEDCTPLEKPLTEHRQRENLSSRNMGRLGKYLHFFDFFPAVDKKGSRPCPPRPSDGKWSSIRARICRNRMRKQGSSPGDECGLSLAAPSRYDQSGMHISGCPGYAGPAGNHRVCCIGKKPVLPDAINQIKSRISFSSFLKIA